MFDVHVIYLSHHVSEIALVHGIVIPESGLKIKKIKHIKIKKKDDKSLNVQTL